MDFNRQPAHRARGPRVRFITPFSAAMLHKITYEILQYFPARTGLPTLQDNDGMRISFTDEEWTVDWRMIGMRDFLIQFRIYWEDVAGGDSVVYLENCLGLPMDPVFMEFVDYFERMLESRLNNFVDLTV